MLLRAGRSASTAMRWERLARSLPGCSVYAAVKAAAAVLSRYMAVELGSARFG